MTPSVSATRSSGAASTAPAGAWVRSTMAASSWSRWSTVVPAASVIVRVVSVPIETGEPLKPGAPKPLFNASLEEATDRQYDATADGQRFLLNRTSTRDSAPVTVVFDWTALLERTP